MITVKATREGLIGATTASGYVIDAKVPYVALPSNLALKLWVKVCNPRNGLTCRALVLDVGPWNTRDHDYVFQPATISGVTDGIAVTASRPKAESNVLEHPHSQPCNGAGIDLGEAVWQALGMTDNGFVEWEFD